MNKLKEHNKKSLMLILLYSLFMSKTFAIETQEVTILADDGYPPYSFIETGEVKGIYVDIVKEAAKLLAPHYKVTIVAYPWKRALHEIKKGTAFAIIPPYQHIKVRPYIWPYSVQIIKEEVIAFCNKDINLLEHMNAKTTEHNPPIRIGVNAGYLILNEELEQARKENKIIIAENKSTKSNIMKLYARRVDCYLNDKYSTYNELSKMQKETKISFDNIKEAFLVMIQTGHIGYTDASTHTFLFKDDFILRMDEALSQVISSNTYQNIIDSYTAK
jgi:polar amino acid transport system substrate-binding protein